MTLTWCSHVGGLGPPFPFCQICANEAALTRAALAPSDEEVKKKRKLRGRRALRAPRAERNALRRSLTDESSS